MDSKKNILIIDDQLAPREAIRMILETKYAVTAVAGAAEAYKYLAGNSVDLVLLDIRMPGIDGITALKEIRKEYPEMRVILLSAHIPSENTQKTFTLEIYGYLMKPFDKDELLDIVDSALRER